MAIKKLKAGGALGVGGGRGHWGSRAGDRASRTFV